MILLSLFLVQAANGLGVIKAFKLRKTSPWVQRESGVIFLVSGQKAPRGVDSCGPARAHTHKGARLIYIIRF